MSTAIYGLIVMTCVGAVFGVVLAYANKKFAVEVNPLIHLVDDVLPKGQCGACGYAGCMAYAEAVVLNPDVPPNLCIPGKEPVATAVAQLTDKVAEATLPVVAHVRCRGTHAIAVDKYEYQGVQDCSAANLLQGGSKGCSYGCLGFGTCVSACLFEAMTMGEDGLPVIDEDKCTGCGNCVKACPKKVIAVSPVGSHVSVNCNSNDKGADARKLCTAACIGCGICGKNCPHNAITMVKNLAIVDHQICIDKCNEATCIAKCPTKAISTLVS